MADLPRLAEVIDRAGRANGFDIIRLLAAVAVILSHAVPITFGDNRREWVWQITGGQASLGHLAVAVFFIASGFLVSMSWDRSRSVWSFVRNRALRVLPALWVCVALLALLLGPALTKIDTQAYFASPILHSFAGNALLLSANYALPGVFADRPFPAVNGSLWTLKFEVASYALGAMLLALSARSGRRGDVALLALLTVVLIAPWSAAATDGLGYVATMFAHLFAYYLAGLLMWRWRAHVPVSGPMALLAAGIAIGALWVSMSLFLVAASYAVIVGAYVMPAALHRLMTVDVSYGVYIYAFPVQQLFWPWTSKLPLPAAANAIVALPIVLVVAWLSARLIEQPALRLKRHFDRPAAPPPAVG